MKRLILLMALSIGVTLWAVGAKAGGEVGNGDGRGENNIAFAFQNLSSYIDACLNAPRCGITDVERNLLTAIRGGLVHEGRLIYISPRANPAEGARFSDGQPSPRVAVTGDSIGTPIYINTDRLDDLEVPTAVSILIHELGHHHGVSDHAVLDALGTKVNLMLRAHSQSIRWNNVTVNSYNLGSRPQILVSTSMQSPFNRDDTTEVSSELQTVLHCPWTGATLERYSVENLRWGALSSNATGPAYGPRRSLVFEVLMSCRLTSGELLEWSGDEVTLPLQFVGTGYSEQVFLLAPRSEDGRPSIAPAPIFLLEVEYNNQTYRRVSRRHVPLYISTANREILALDAVPSFGYNVFVLAQVFEESADHTARYARTYDGSVSFVSAGSNEWSTLNHTPPYDGRPEPAGPDVRARAIMIPGRCEGPVCGGAQFGS